MLKLEMKAASGSCTWKESSLESSVALFSTTLVILVVAYLARIVDSMWNVSYKTDSSAIAPTWRGEREAEASQGKRKSALAWPSQTNLHYTTILRAINLTWAGLQQPRPRLFCSPAVSRGQLGVKIFSCQLANLRLLMSPRCIWLYSLHSACTLLERCYCC